MVKYVYDDNKNLVLATEIDKVNEQDEQLVEETFTDDDKWNDIDYMRRCIIYGGTVDSKSSIAYARVSSRKQVIENQINIFRELGINVVFADKMSGFRYKAMERPDFKSMINYLDTNKDIKTLFVFEVSRLGRNMSDSVATFAKLEQELGIRIISLTEPWTHMIDDDNRPLMISIFSWMNEMESKRISRRTKAGQLRARKEKGVLAGRIPDVYFKRELVEKLRERGWTWDEIANHKDIRCNPSTIHRTREQWRQDDLGRESQYSKYKKTRENIQKNKKTNPKS